MLGLQQGNAVLKEIHKEMNPESVERLLEETAEAQAYQRVRIALHIPPPASFVSKANDRFDPQCFLLFLPFFCAGDRRDAGNTDDNRGRRRRSIRTRSPRTRSWHPNRRTEADCQPALRSSDRSRRTRTRDSARTTTPKTSSCRREASCTRLSYTQWKVESNKKEKKKVSCIGGGGLCFSGAVWMCAQQLVRQDAIATCRPRRRIACPSRAQGA